MEKITPRIDIAFKKIFGVDENKDLLVSLINSIVNEEDKIAEVTILNPYNPKKFKEDNLSALHVKAKSKTGRRYNIEIQVSGEADSDKRALYYWTKPYTEQLKIMESYSTLSKSIGIHILNFTSTPNEKKYHNVFNIRKKESNLFYFKDLELHTIELGKFCDNVHEDLADITAKIKNSLDIWVTFLTCHDLLNKNRLSPKLDNPEIKKALGVLEAMNFEEGEWQAYEDRAKWFMIETNALKKCEADVREEERKTMAKTMISKGLSLELIQEVTQLDMETIQEVSDRS